MEQHVAEDKWDKLCSDYFCTIEKVGNIRTKKSSTMIKRVERSRSVKSEREYLVYTPLLEKLWLFSYSNLKWETKQKTPNSSNVEWNIFFFHLHFRLGDNWEKLKHIVRNLQPTNLKCLLL